MKPLHKWISSDITAELIPKLEFEKYFFYKKFKAQFKTVPLTWFSTSIAISMNMSCSSRMEFSNLIISACLASISASVCFACCVSIIICNHTPLQYCYISHTALLQKILSTIDPIVWQMIETYVFRTMQGKYIEEMLVTQSENYCSFTWPHLLCNFPLSATSHF